MVDGPHRVNCSPCDTLNVGILGIFAAPSRIPSSGLPNRAEECNRDQPPKGVSPS